MTYHHMSFLNVYKLLSVIISVYVTHFFSLYPLEQVLLNFLMDKTEEP